MSGIDMPNDASNLIAGMQGDDFQVLKFIDFPIRSGPSICSIYGFGRISEIYKRPGNFPQLIDYGPTIATTKWLGNRKGVFYSTTLLGINPDFNKQGNLFYEDMINNIGAIKSSIESRESFEQTLDEAIFLAAPWDFNYQHFLVETFPRIFLIISCNRFSDLPIIVRDEQFIRDILVIAFPSQKFIYLRDGEFFQIKNKSIFVTPIAKNFGDQPTLLHESLRYIRAKVLSQTLQRGQVGRLTYIKRLFKPEHSGARRTIVNEKEIVKIVEESGGLVDFFEGKNFYEKAKLVSNAGIIVTPIGANVINFIFCFNEVKLIIIMHPVFINGDWFINLLINIGVPVLDCHLFSNVSVAQEIEGDDVLDSNLPFYVDAAALECKISSVFLNRGFS